VTLAPGESMFMAANEPHAYLSGGAYIVVHISVCPYLSGCEYLVRDFNPFGMCVQFSSMACICRIAIPVRRNEAYRKRSGHVLP
jgi:hypothetical protein